MGGGGDADPSGNRLLFLVNICTAFDNKLF